VKKLTFLIISLIICSFCLVGEVKAGVDDKVSGWAWSETIGWISSNCINQDTCATIDYGVDIDVNDKFIGFAWSENIGWIDFAPAGPYPEIPNYSAKMIANNQVSGWVRALAYGGGWDGWIKMSDGNYGVSLNGGEFSGWAWGSEVVGWISFNGANVTGGPDYKVEISSYFNSSPAQPGIPAVYKPSGVIWEHCLFKGKSMPVFYWTYFDPDNDPQAAYEIRINDNADFPEEPGPAEFTELVTGAGTSYNPSHRLEEWAEWMNWATDYWWIVKVQDDQGNWSIWSEANLFTAPLHAYPWSDFSWLPEDPDQQEVVIFDPEEEGVFYFWTVTEGEEVYTDGTGPTNEEPHIKFLTSTNKIKLRVTDSSAYSCESDEQEIMAQLPLPEYEEVPPIIWLKQTLAALAGFFNGFLSY